MSLPSTIRKFVHWVCRISLKENWIYQAMFAPATVRKAATTFRPWIESLEVRINPGGSGGSAGTHAPVTMDNTVGTSEDTPYTFQLADFDFSDPNDDPVDDFAAVKVISLPTNGTLVLGFDGVALDQEIDVADIEANKLRFIPDLNEFGSAYATWNFAVVDSSSTNDTSATHTMTINVAAVDPFVYFASYEFGGNQGETAQITVALSETSTEDVTVYCETTDVTAEAGEDYTAFGDYVTILAGYLSATFDIILLEQTEAEDAKSFTISMSDPTNADIGDASVANFVIVTTLGAEEDPIDELNELGGQIDDRLETIDGLITQFNGYSSQLPGLRQAEDDWDYFGVLSEISTNVLNGLNGLLSISDQIISHGEDAASAEKSQGMKYRIFGINAHMSELTSKLTQVTTALGNEKAVFEATYDNADNVVFALQQLINPVQARINRANNIFTANINHAIPESAPASIATLNSNFGDMSTLFAAVVARHVAIIAFDISLYAIAVDGSFNRFSYDSVLLSLSSFATANFVDCTDNGQNAFSVVNKRTAAYADINVNDVYAIKGLEQYVTNFASYLLSERNLVNAQYAYMFGILQGDEDDSILVSLSACATELNNGYQILITV